MIDFYIFSVKIIVYLSREIILLEALLKNYDFFQPYLLNVLYCSWKSWTMWSGISAKFYAILSHRCFLQQQSSIFISNVRFWISSKPYLKFYYYLDPQPRPFIKKATPLRKKGYFITLISSKADTICSFNASPVFDHVKGDTDVNSRRRIFQMFLNSVNDEVVIFLRIFSLLVGVFCLITVYKSWGYFCDNVYRKYGGHFTINMVIFMSFYTVVLLAFDIGLSMQAPIYIRGCTVLLCFELFQPLTVFSWFFLHISTVQDILKLQRWPSLSLNQHAAIAYVIPSILTATTTLILWSTDAVMCERKLEPSKGGCTIDTCSIDCIGNTKLVMGCLVILPMLLVIIGNAVQHVRCLIVAMAAWKMQNFTLRRKIVAFLTRSDLGRPITNIAALMSITLTIMLLLFLSKDNADFLKIIYSTLMSMFVSITIICLLVWCLK